VQRLGPETRVEFGRRGLPGLWVSFAIEDDTYWVAMPRVAIERTLPKQLIAWISASLVLALFAPGSLPGASIARCKRWPPTHKASAAANNRRRWQKTARTKSAA